MVRWECKQFNDLGPHELYAVLRLRGEVFVVEQNCPYLDPDNKDQHAWHLMAWRNDQLVAYTRLLPPGASYSEASIGRVVTSPSERGTGLGKELMRRSLMELKKLFHDTPVRIGAQLYLKKFYTELGFTAVGEVYLEDGIPHVEMTRSNS
ncbi:MAG TPA: GNAT family N-acetyltransferase [Chitinophagaceae bacterium]|nr:GNAT family N-acetyltransferase [Chitinophagaceae bacterium]